MSEPVKRSKSILIDAAGKGGRKKPVDKTPYHQPKDARPLTAIQQRFAMALIAGASQTDAYLQAYPAARDYERKLIWEKASRMAKNPKIATMVAQAQAEAVAQAQEEYKYGLREAIAEINEAKAFAIQNVNPAAVMKAVELKTKLHGLHVEDRQNLRRPYGDLTEEALLEQIKAKAKALGIDLAGKV